MGQATAPGLTADWLNGWLAAIGVTVLVPTARLAWTTDGVPKGRFEFDGDYLATDIARALPSLDQLNGLTIARNHPDSPIPLDRLVSLKAYRERAHLARQRHDSSLSTCLTDLSRNADDRHQAAHSPFDPPAPRGETLFTRLIRCRTALIDIDLPKAVANTLNGHGRRIKANGLGFDYRRLTAAAVAADVTVDPVVECLVFFGMHTFPVRGTGSQLAARGWTAPPSQRRAFTWPVWSPYLDRWSVDALLDRWYMQARKAHSYGVTGAYAAVPYKPTTQNDVTRAYASERIW